MSRITQGVGEGSVGRDPASTEFWIAHEAKPLLKQLRQAVNELDDAIDDPATPMGPAGGQVGGTFPDQLDVRGIRETGGPTLLTIGAVADGEFLQRVGATLVGAAPPSGVSTDGSIFSMVGPLGAAAPVVAYDFTLFDASLSDAQNLINANQSGNAALDLVGAGATPEFLTINSSPSQPYGWTPFASRVDGGALISGTVGMNSADTSGSPAALQLLGAMSAEWCGYLTGPPGGGSIELLAWYGGPKVVAGGGSSETEANNQLYRLYWSQFNLAWEYFHESGAGVDSERGLIFATEAQFSGFEHNPVQFTLTRSSAGVVALYVNGRLASTPGVGSGTALPTGGTTGDLIIGLGGTNGTRISTLGVRIFDVELTPAQAQESYRRTYFGVGTG